MTRKLDDRPDCLKTKGRNVLKITLKVAPISLCLLSGIADLGQANTITISAGASIQAAVNANPGGTTFSLKPGTYRMQTVTAKSGDVFVGQSGAILNGSELLTSFSEETINGVTYWVADGPTSSGQLISECDNSFPMCQYPENVYIDSEPLLRASSLSAVTTATCYYDYGAGKIYIRQNPSGHTVESSSTPVAFAQGPNNITIKGLIIEKYATPGQRTAIGGQYAGDNWIVENNEVRLNHSEGIKVGNGGQVLNNYVHDNGQAGILVSATTTSVLVNNNEVARNNWAGFRTTYEAGGVKFADVLDLTAAGNYIHDNQGVGLWCDGSCQGGVYEYNTVQNNAFHGIMHEISHAWTIRNNIVIGNGFGTSWGEWLGGAGIEIDESDHVEVANNFVGNNYRAIVLGMAVRSNAPWADLNNTYVHDNMTVTGGTNGTTGLHQSVNNNAYYTSKANRFVSDDYCMPSSSRGWFWWMNTYQTTPNWKNYGEDDSGTWACPGVLVTTPSNGATVSGTVSVNAGAADPTSIAKVVFYVDGTAVETDTTSPYTYSWNTTAAANGGHVVEAEAYNNAGQSARSSVTVTVQNQ